MNTERSDILVIGGSLGGVSATLAAAKLGATVALVEETDWVGGQLTAQGVCTPDENRWIETTGCTTSYRRLRNEIRRHYRENHTLSDLGRAQRYLNPGSCWVSRISVEPLVARQILTNLLAGAKTANVFLHTSVVETDVSNDRVTAVIAENDEGVKTRFEAEVVLDATELGDLLPMTGAEYSIGAESLGETGEPDAPNEPHPDWIQPFTFPFALELRPCGENHVIDPPDDYLELKSLQNYHLLDGAMRRLFGEMSWWTYRRVIAADNFDDPAFPCDVAMINTGSNDFKGGVIPSGLDDVDRETEERARRAALGYVYWLQTEAPREDNEGAIGYPELRLRNDWFNTLDGISPKPYIRESRRMKTVVTIREQDVVRPGSSAKRYEDSCGIGHYWLDIHCGSSPEPPRFYETSPFQIPLGALIPIRMRNLLPACKNAGCTHLTNGAYRLHPIEWNVGESAGILAAFCLNTNVEPRTVYEDKTMLQAYRDLLRQEGVLTEWDRAIEEIR